MNRASIFCENCERTWTIGAALSYYEQQTLESRPCPNCGLYTLACQEVRQLAGKVPHRYRVEQFVPSKLAG